MEKSVKRKETKAEPKSLKTRGDEIRVQSHLLNLELKDQVKLLKKDKYVIERNFKLVTPILMKAVKRIRSSLKPVMTGLKGTYKRTKAEIWGLHSKKV